MSSAALSTLAAQVSPMRRALSALAREREALPEIPDAQIEIIRFIETGGEATPSSIALALGSGRPTVSNLLATMESAGLITRRRDVHDGRRIVVNVSAAARDYFARFDAATSAIMTEAAAQLSPADQAALIAAAKAFERLTGQLVLTRGGAHTPSSVSTEQTEQERA